VSIPPPREAERAGAVIAHLASGRSAAIVTDAGTPAVSDPGSRLVSEARAAGFRVVPIPGANAVATALAGAGLGGGGFLFLGFLPPQGMQRRRAIEEIATSPRTVVMFEAPHRLERTLMDLRHACGDERRGVIARELTKLHEEFVCGPLRDLVAALPERVRGEITLLVEGVQPGTGARSYAAPPRAESLASVVDELLRGGMSAARAAREASRRLGCDRRDAYRAALAARTQTPPKEPDRQ